MSYIGQQLPADVFSGYVTDTFTGDGSATTFTLSKAPFSADSLIVVVDNVIQQPTTNFTVSGTTLTIVGTAILSGIKGYAIHTGGPLPIGSASALDATTACTITTDDNTDTLSLISTDADANSGPNLRLYRNSGSPAVGDNLGQIDFEGRNDNSEDVVYASMMVRARDETDGTEDGGFQLDIMQGGTLRSLMKYYSDGAAQELSFNDDSIDVDFRVESNGNTHMLFVDGGNDDVRIGTATSFGPHDAGLKVKGDITIGDFTNDSAAATLGFIKSRNTTVGSQTIVADDDEIGRIAFRADDGNDANYNNNVAAIFCQIDSAPGTDDTGGRLHFSTTADGARTVTERMRIDRNGKVLIGSTADATSSNIQVITPDNNARVGFFQSTHSSNPFGILIDFDQAAPNNAVQSFLDGHDSSASRFSITSNGAFYGNGTYGTLSDERIKKDIVDANSQWDDIKAIKVRNFKKKVDGDSAIVEIGVVAQELEAVSPKLISELQPSKGEIRVNSEFGTLWTTDDAETKDGVDAVLYTAEDADVINGKNVEGGIKIPATHSKKVGDVKEVKQKVKGVKYSVLQIKALKALQEAMARIETLETKVKALEDA